MIDGQFDLEIINYAIVMFERGQLVGEVSGNLWVMLAKDGCVKLVAEAVNGAVVLDIDSLDQFTPSAN